MAQDSSGNALFGLYLTLSQSLPPAEIMGTIGRTQQTLDARDKDPLRRAWRGNKAGTPCSWPFRI